MANSIWINPFGANVNGSAVVFTTPAQFPDGTNLAPAIAFASAPTTGWFRLPDGGITFSASSVALIAYFSSEVQLKSTAFLAWSSGAIDAGDDVGLSRLSPGVLGVGNGTAGSFAATLKTTTINAVTGYQVNGVAGATFGPAAVASITIVGGIVTAVS